MSQFFIPIHSLYNLDKPFQNRNSSRENFYPIIIENIIHHFLPIVLYYNKLNFYFRGGSFMRKFLSICISFLLLISLIACQSEEPASSIPQQTTEKFLSVVFDVDYESWNTIVDQITEISATSINNEDNEAEINNGYAQIQELFNFVSSYLIDPQRMLEDGKLMIVRDAVLSYVADSQMTNLSFDQISETENDATYRVTVDFELTPLDGTSPIPFQQDITLSLKKQESDWKVFDLRLHNPDPDLFNK